MDREKYVDESWKESAAKEKDVLQKAKLDKQEPKLEIDKNFNNAKETTKKSYFSPEIPDEEEASSSQPFPEGGDSSYGEFELNFINYITSLGFQAMIFLGEVPHPMTNEMAKDLQQAKLLIDTLSMLKEKTKGNLNAQEEKLLSITVYELQMKYVEVQKNENK